MTKRKLNHEYIQFLARKKLPVKAGWRNGSIKYFLKKMDEGSDDTGTVLTTQINLLKEIKRNTVVNC